jgi:hypothetical protein
MTSSDVHREVFLLAWNCLSRTDEKMKAGAYDVLFPEADLLEGALDEAGFRYAPGLLDALQSDTPPTIDFFKSLPTEVRRNGKDRWGVYVLVLEKRGRRSKIYIGCGTNTKGGLFKRFNDYQKNTYLISESVEAAIKDGFVVVSKVLLGWCAQPIELHAYVVRGLCLLLEATFTFSFWAFQSRTKNYGYPNFCLWQTNDIGYDGLCGHSSLIEAIRTRNVPLPPGITKWTQPKKWICTDCDSHFENESDLKIHLTTDKHKNKIAGIDNAVESTKYTRAWGKDNIASKRYYCKVCDKPFSTSSKLVIHRATDKHKNNQAEADEVAKASKSSF